MIQRFGIWLGVGVGLLFFVAAGAWAFREFKATQILTRRASGGNDTWDAYYAVLRYSEDHSGLLPPLDPEPGRLMFERHVMFSEYMMTGRHVSIEYDPDVPVGWKDYDRDPRHRKNPDLIDDYSIWYLGYRVTNEAEGRAFVAGYIQAMLAKVDFGDSLPVPEPWREGLPESLPRLYAKEGTAFAEPSPAVNPEAAMTVVFIEHPGHYLPYTGGWVVYLDGHREFIPYPGRFPMTEEFIGGLRAIDDLGRIFAR